MGEYILSTKRLVFLGGKLEDETTQDFEDHGEAINAYEACVNDMLVLQARLVDMENGYIIRRYIKHKHKLVEATIICGSRLRRD